MATFARNSRALWLIVGAPFFVLGITVLAQNADRIVAQVPQMTLLEEQQAQSSAPAERRCVGDGVQVCRCYCRAEFHVCQNDQVSYSSVPLCKVPWTDGTCSSIAYFQTQASDAGSCAANNGQACGGFVRPGDTPDALLNQTVAGQLLGCEMQALAVPAR